MNTSTTANLTEIRRTDQTYLPALRTSAALSRLFVRGVCSYWQCDEACTGTAELLVSELVSNAIVASGVTRFCTVGSSASTHIKLIGLRLLELADSVVIEVWDTSRQQPLLIEPSEDQEDGRGLQLVDALSIRWRHYDASMGGKVVWCQLARDDAADTDSTEDAAAFLQKALQAHPWNDQA
jgi:hypothetical protein